MTVAYEVAREDGTIIHSSAAEGLSQFMIGAGTVFKGVDDAVREMRVGETKTVRLAPEDAYGNCDESRVVSIPMNLGHLSAGDEVDFTGLDRGVVVHTDPGTVEIDFNHPLAGEAVAVTVELLAVDADAG